MNSGAGLSIIGTTALLFALVMVGGGLFLWWPRRTSAWKSALRFNPRLKGRAFTLNLHTTVGAYVGVVVFVVALTAVPLSLGWAKAAMFAVTGTTDMTEDAKLPIAARKSIEPKSGAVISMQAAWGKARGVIGGPLLWASLHYPRKGEPIEIGIVETGAPHADARSYVFIDSRTAQIVELRPWATLNAGSKLYYWLLALHTGHFGGVFVQCLMLAGMIGVAALGYTGVETFLRRTFRRPRTSTTRGLSRLER
jgi:vanillate O-demethylase ferredoxin subunit